MDREFIFDNKPLDEEVEELDEQNLETESCLTEADFYPPSDDRVWTSNVEDVEGGDNFADYCEYIFELYEEEGYFEE